MPLVHEQVRRHLTYELRLHHNCDFRRHKNNVFKFKSVYMRAKCFERNQMLILN